MSKGKEKRRGIGVYSYQQTKYSTPFGLFVVIVVGIVFCALGGARLATVLQARHTEFLALGSADPHVWGFVYSVSTIGFGVFLAHAGVIYWVRRLTAHMRDRYAQRERSAHQSHHR
jgi:hypothetical protein